MHECPRCERMCDCDQEDVFNGVYGRTWGGPRCTHNCEAADDEERDEDIDFDDDEAEWDDVEAEIDRTKGRRR